MRAKQGRGVKTGERQRSDMLRECQESRAVLVFVFFISKTRRIVLIIEIFNPEQQDQCDDE